MIRLGMAQAIGAVLFGLMAVGSVNAAPQEEHRLLSSTSASSTQPQSLPPQETPTRRFMDPAWRNQFEERDQELRYQLSQELPHTPYRLDHTVIEFLNSRFWLHMTLPELHVEHISRSLDSNGNPSITFQQNAISKRINQRLHQKITEMMTGIREDSADNIELQQALINSLNYNVTTYTPTLLSLSFTRMSDSGGAHPTLEESTHNFDLNTGEELQLANLFKPDSAYLNRLSEVSNVQLPQEIMKRRSAEDTEQAQDKEEALASYQETYKVLPAKEYFENWNLTEKGLLITFEYGLFCGHACGMPSIIIPYATLQDILRPNVVKQYFETNSQS